MATIDGQPFQSPFLINFQWIAESNQPDIQTNQTWKCKNKWIHWSLTLIPHCSATHSMVLLSLRNSRHQCKMPLRPLRHLRLLRTKRRAQTRWEVELIFGFWRTGTNKHVKWAIQIEWIQYKNIRVSERTQKSNNIYEISEIAILERSILEAFFREPGTILSRLP